MTSTLTPEGPFLRQTETFHRPASEFARNILSIYLSIYLSLSLAVPFAGAPGYPHAIGQPLQSYLLGTEVTGPTTGCREKEKLGDLLCKRSVDCWDFDSNY